MNKPEQDGKVVLVVKSHMIPGPQCLQENWNIIDTHETVIYLKDALHVHEAESGLHVQYAHKRTIYPWSNMIQVDIHYNSDQYQEDLLRWSEEAHPTHTTGNEDTDCTMCQEKMNSDARAAAGFLTIPGGIF